MGDDMREQPVTHAAAARRHGPRSLAALAVLLVALAALIAGASTRVAVAAPVRIMPLGDSITDGYNVPGGYRVELEDELLAAGYEFDFVGSRVNGPDSLADREHEGHSGLRIDQLARLVDASVARHQPEVVLLMIGTNDVLQGYRLAEAPQRVSELIDRIAARAPSATILVSSLTPLAAASAEERVRGYNAAIPRIVRNKAAEGRPVVFVDMHPALTTSDLADGVHPNRTGYRKMAAVWRTALPPAPAASEPPSAPAVGEPPPAPAAGEHPPHAPVGESGPLPPPPPALMAPVIQATPGSGSKRRLVDIADRRLRADRRGIVRLRLMCHRDAPCSGVVRLMPVGARARRRPMATRRFRVPSAMTASVTLRMTRSQHRLLKRRGSTRVSIEAVVRADERRYVTRRRGRLTAR